jgi:hypothetical protein
MTPSGGDIPAPTALQTILRGVTETIAEELACPTHRVPDWSEFEWVAARAVAAMHGVSPLLSRTLHWRGPAGWMQFLAAQRAHTAKRHARVAELLSRIDHAARAAGVAAVALKGVALHAMGVYAVGDRPMSDIDLLVRPADSERASRVLRSLGFRETIESWKERVFTPIDGRRSADLGEHSENNIKIELHERICERLPWRMTDASELIFPLRPHPGLNAYPSKAALMMHLLLHAAGTMPTRTLRLLHLHDIAQLSSRMSDSDWNDVLARSEPRCRLWWAYPPIELTSRYYAWAIPSRILAFFAEECPWLLTRISRRRTLYDVSFSYLWIDAFPGIEWSQSIGELLSYAASRVRPSRKHVALRAHVAESETWASDSQWAHLSQGRRVLRWITSHPPRPLTMHAVHAASAQAGWSQ